MTRIKWVAMCLVSLVAVGAVGVSSAGAALPELGRCEKVAPKSGRYVRGCVKEMPGAGNYEWMSGPGANKKFRGSTQESATFETANKSNKITCLGGFWSGEFTSSKTLTLKMGFVPCEDSKGQLCQTVRPKTGEIETETLEGEWGYIKSGAQPIVGLDLKHSPLIATFECGEFPVETEETTVTLEGSVIGRMMEMVDKMSPEWKSLYRVKKGKSQQYEQFEGGPTDTLTANFTFVSVGGVKKVSEPIALITTIETANEEPLEVKAK